MAVSETVVIPAQPTTGVIEFLPLGGNGQIAPLGCYMIDVQLAGDASGGLAAISVSLDPRYTNLVAFYSATVDSAATAPDYFMDIRADAAASGFSGPAIVGTMPHTAIVSTPSASFLWYPPPIYYPGGGHISLAMLNVDATEVYAIVAEVYCFDIDIRKITPMGILQMNVPGVSAPASI